MSNTVTLPSDMFRKTCLSEYVFDTNTYIKLL